MVSDAVGYSTVFWNQTLVSSLASDNSFLSPSGLTWLGHKPSGVAIRVPFLGETLSQSNAADLPLHTVLDPVLVIIQGPQLVPP